MLRVGYFGTWESGYPRNEQVISCLRRAGAEVTEIHQPVWTDEHKFGAGLRLLPRLAAAETRLLARRLPDDLDVLLVGYPGQRDVWPATRHGLPVVFNAMVSLYDTFVDDRARFRAGTLPARALRALDRAAFRRAQLVVADTAANAAYFSTLADLDDVAHCYVGAEERIFEHRWQPPENFTVLFVGKLIPLHGLPLILEAARRLPDVSFRLIGSGQQAPVIADRPANVEHVPWVPYERLADEYARAGCALGIFGSSDKVGRVIPNKAFQALAVGTPLITADTPAARELLTGGTDALLVERSAAALADAIRTLRDTDAGARLGGAGRATFEREASETVLGRRWLGLLQELVA